MTPSSKSFTIIHQNNISIANTRKKMVTILPKPTNVQKLSIRDIKTESKCLFVRPWESEYHSKNSYKRRSLVFQGHDKEQHPPISWPLQYDPTRDTKQYSAIYQLPLFPSRTPAYLTNNANATTPTGRIFHQRDLNDSGYCSPFQRESHKTRRLDISKSHLKVIL